MNAYITTIPELKLRPTGYVTLSPRQIPMPNGFVSNVKRPTRVGTYVTNPTPVLAHA
jgi:hypothetical protein